MADRLEPEGGCASFVAHPPGLHDVPDVRANWPYVDQWSSKREKERIMKCPACNLDLLMMERQGVEVDYCPQCRGVWLDRGELDKIIQRSTLEFSQNPPNESAYAHQGKHHGHEHGKGYYKKKRSFLMDLFD
jgi:Zn-finger nucleic acid-binding protein